MKILHTISSLEVKAGGTATCTYDLVKGLNDNHCPTDILVLDISDSTDKFVGNDFFVKVLPNDSKTGYVYSKNFKKALSEMNDYSLYHLNGMWQYIHYISALTARSKKKPYIVTLHGMLYPQALSKSSLKKKFFLKIQFNKILQSADCIHATCIEEMNYYRKLGFKNPIAVIPNPISIPEYINTIKSNKDKKRIGFLGRLHPRKNILTLINSWAILGNKVKDAELYIMGKGDEAYEAMLKDEVRRLNLNNVVFAGLVDGHEKFEKLANLTVLVVPSDFENFGMIVTEALIMKVPVIASKGTPWEELTSRHCGWWVENNLDSIANTIDEAITLPINELLIMGENGRKLVEDEYIVDVVAKKMIKLYEWLLINGEKPDFVYL